MRVVHVVVLAVVAEPDDLPVPDVDLDGLGVVSVSSHGADRDDPGREALALGQSADKARRHQHVGGVRHTQERSGRIRFKKKTSLSEKVLYKKVSSLSAALVPESPSSTLLRDPRSQRGINGG